jgi:hypothetical protein
VLTLIPHHVAVCPEELTPLTSIVVCIAQGSVVRIIDAHNLALLVVRPRRSDHIAPSLSIWVLVNDKRDEPILHGGRQRCIYTRVKSRVENPKVRKCRAMHLCPSIKDLFEDGYFERGDGSGDVICRTINREIAGCTLA